jgi:hypothetical protein
LKEGMFSQQFCVHQRHTVQNETAAPICDLCTSRGKARCFSQSDSRKGRGRLSL